MKSSLRDEFPDVKSSHLTEALAAGLGFRTHAALQAALVGPEQDRPFRLLDSTRFVQRLVEFGYQDDPEFAFELMNPVTGVIKTTPLSAYDIEYKTQRARAYRNLMVSAVNAALELKLFTLRPGDDRFIDNNRHGHLFDFQIAGMPARGSIAEAGHDEIAVHAAVNPKGDEVRYFSSGFSAGDAFGYTWVERQTGAWMQSADSSLRCRKTLLSKLAELIVEPNGFGDRGNVIM
jgi:hypothetical protein